MAITTVSVISNQIYLGDVSPAVSRLEKNSKPTDRAWIQVRQATEQDAMILEASLPETRIEYVDEIDPITRQPVRRAIETRDDRVRNRFAMQVWLCLVDAGNINDGDSGDPLFSFKDGVNYSSFDGGFQDFLQRFGQLPPVVTITMRDIVYDHNPQWDWRQAFVEDEDADEGEAGEGVETEGLDSEST
jgi:hypothetical protein